LESPNREGPAIGSATLILDVRGRIQFCSRAVASVFGRDMTNLLDQPITVLVPDLPIRAQTPGYNVAYASFWFSDRKWHRFRATDGGARSFIVDLALSLLNLGGTRGFVLDVRHSAAAVAADAVLRRQIDGIHKRTDAALITDVVTSREPSVCAQVVHS